MRVSLPIWQAIYSHDRRAHRHRCVCCRRILTAGEEVLMFRLPGYKGTKSMHLACGDRIFLDELTYREMAVYRAIEYSIVGMGFSPKSVFNAATENVISQTVDFSQARLQAYGLSIEGWPAQAAAAV